MLPAGGRCGIAAGRREVWDCCLPAGVWDYCLLAGGVGLLPAGGRFGIAAGLR